jgi:terminase small subunit / prophage DNA-packing protein
MSGTKGKGTLVNRTGLSDVFGVALNTIDSWVRQGCPVVQRGAGKGQPWQFNTADVAAWLRARAATEATGKTESDENELRLRRLRAETAKAELELAAARGEVAPIAEFEKAQALVFATLRANIMNVPQRVVVRLLGETNETTFKQILRTELTEALKTTSEMDPDMGEESEDDDGDGEE